MLTSQIPTYPVIPPLQSSSMLNNTPRAYAISMSPSKRLPGSSAMKLTTVLEHKPPTYQPARITATYSAETLDIFESDSFAGENDGVSSFLEVTTQDRCSRTSTMSSVLSAESHQAPGAIYIRPSAQLQNMQSMSDRDARLEEAARYYRPGVGWTVGRANTSGVYTPTGTPESISNIPLQNHVYQAHSNLNRSLRPIQDISPSMGIHNWAKSSEWVEPCNTGEGPTEWIEDFLSRKEQADREEEEKMRNERKEKIAVMRGNSIGKFRRRLSLKRGTEERRIRRSGEARWESTDIANIPERPRTFSWDLDTHEDIGRDALPDSSGSDGTPSPPPLYHSEKRFHRLPSTPYRRGHSQAFCDPFASTPATPATPATITNRDLQHCHKSGSKSTPQTPRHSSYVCRTRTSSLPKLRFRSVSLTSADVKRSLSTNVIPAFAEGRNSVHGFVDKVEKLGGGLTRGLSTRIKFGLKGLRGGDAVKQ